MQKVIAGSMHNRDSDYDQGRRPFASMTKRVKTIMFQRRKAEKKYSLRLQCRFSVLDRIDTTSCLPATKDQGSPSCRSDIAAMPKKNMVTSDDLVERVSRPVSAALP